MRRLQRPLLALTALAVLSALWWACGGDEAQVAETRSDEQPPLRPWSVQLHVHGSFSEGLGSIDSESREAADVGLDVLWWSDHDWRLSGYHTLSRFSFEEGPVVHDRLGDWVLTDARFESKFAPHMQPVARRSAATGDVRHSTERAHDGERSYQVTAACLGPEFRDYVAQLDAPLPGYRRPLASELELSFALWVDGVSADGRVWLEARLSEHPTAESEVPQPEGEGDGFAPRFVRYVIGDPASAPYREGPGGTVLWIPLESPRGGGEGEWRVHTVALSADAVRGFPELVGLDNSLTGIQLGISVRNGQAVTAFLDDVRIAAGLRGSPMLARQREVIADVAAGYPGLAQLQGLEISYLHPHLNEFSVDTELFDYDTLAEESGLLDAAREISEADLRDHFARRVVERAHARAGLVSFNHFLGTDPEGRAPERPREEVLAELLGHRLYGSDLLEVGYRDRGGHPLRNHLWVWDRLALEGALRPVGIGVSDHHGGPDRWHTMANNFVSWIYARSPTKADLIEGLRAGRVYFGDLTEFQGKLDLSTDRGQAMGQIVLSDRRTVELDVAIDGLEATDRVILVESGELTRFLDVEGESFRTRQTLALPPAGGFARVEAFARDGQALVFSNPIHFIRELPAEGLDPARGALDVAGVRSLDLGGFLLKDARPVSGDGWQGLRLSGTGRGGTLELSCEGFEEVAVELKGLEGVVRIEGARVTVSGLTGSGRLVLRGGGGGHEPAPRAP